MIITTVKKATINLANVYIINCARWAHWSTLATNLSYKICFLNNLLVQLSSIMHIASTFVCWSSRCTCLDYCPRILHHNECGYLVAYEGTLVTVNFIFKSLNYLPIRIASRAPYIQMGFNIALYSKSLSSNVNRTPYHSDIFNI